MATVRAGAAGPVPGDLVRRGRQPGLRREPGGAVVLLDHEDRFRTRQFVNTSARQLAECLLAYMGERDPDRFRTAVRGIDPAALAEESFWWHEAAGVS